MRLQISFPTVNKAFLELQKLGVVRELTGRVRRRLFACDACLQILGKGTEPIPPAA